MKTMFQAFDGTLFDSDQDAIDYENICSEADFIIIDDDPLILEVLSSRLERAKIKHKTFQDPLQAMNYISKHKVSRVFTDYHMNGFGMSGKWILEICDQYNISCSVVSADESKADISKIEFLKNCIQYMK